MVNVQYILHYTHCRWTFDITYCMPKWSNKRYNVQNYLIFFNPGLQRQICSWRHRILLRILKEDPDVEKRREMEIEIENRMSNIKKWLFRKYQKKQTKRSLLKEVRRRKNPACIYTVITVKMWVNHILHFVGETLPFDIICEYFLFLLNFYNNIKDSYMLYRILLRAFLCPHPI